MQSLNQHADAVSGLRHADAKSELGSAMETSELGSAWSGPDLAARVDKEGHIVLPGLVDTGLCEALIKAINTRVAHLFSFYTELAYDETCSNLLLGGKLFDKTPEGWLDDQAEQRFGPCRLRAWVAAAGTGRMF